MNRKTTPFMGRRMSEKPDLNHHRRRKMSLMPAKPSDSFLVPKDNSLVAYIGGVLKKWVRSLYPVGEKERRSQRSKKAYLSSRSVKRVLPTLRRLSLIEAERRRKPPTTHVTTQLSELEVIAIVTVFEHIYAIIGILETSDLGGKQETSRIFSYQTPIERFYHKPYDLPIKAGRYEVYDNEDREAKRIECVKISKILNETTKELLKDGSYNIFRHAAIIPFLVEREEHDLIQDYKDNLSQIKFLRESIDYCRADSRVKSENQNCQRYRVKGYFRRLKRHNGIETEYMDKWIDSRKFQNTYRLKREEVKMKTSVQQLNTKIKNSAYAHDNIMMYYRADVNKILKKIRRFNQKYEKDKEEITFEVERVTMEIKSAQYMKEDAQAAYNTLQEKMTRLRERRKKAIAEEMLYRRQVEAVSKIERWWLRIHPKVPEQKKKKKGKGKKGKK